MIDLTEEERLLVWRDYFALLREGLSSKPWKDSDGTVEPWLQVFITEIESDILHRRSGQEKFCRFDEPKDLSMVDSNVIVESGSRGSDSSTNKPHSRRQETETERFK